MTLRISGALPCLLATCAMFGSMPPAHAAEPAASSFEELHSLIKRAPGESRWMEIDWYPSVWEGRQVAAREGKPLFFMAGSGGAPCAGC